MRRFCVIISIIVISVMSCFGQTIIEMEKENGIYKIPCTVNGVKMKFIFDSGAATVCISESMAEYLYENDYITIDDFLGVGTSKVADGRIVPNLRLNLRDIEIAGMHLHNVESVVILGLEASLLLGQTAIQALGRVTIDGDRLVIHNASQSMLESQKGSLNVEAAEYFKEGDYRSALIRWRKLYNNDACDITCLYGFAFSLSKDNQYDEALIVTQKWFDLYEMDAPAWMRYQLYNRQAINYFAKPTPDYQEAIKWAQRKIQLIPVVFEDARDADKEMLAMYMFMGRAYFNLNDYSRSLEYNEKAFNLRMSYFDCNNVRNVKKIKDERLGECAFAIATCYGGMDNYSKFSRSLVIAARFGNTDAINLCKEFNIKY